MDSNVEDCAMSSLANSRRRHRRECVFSALLVAVEKTRLRQIETNIARVTFGHASRVEAPVNLFGIFYTRSLVNHGRYYDGASKIKAQMLISNTNLFIS